MDTDPWFSREENGTSSFESDESKKFIQNY